MESIDLTQAFNLAQNIKTCDIFHTDFCELVFFFGVEFDSDLLNRIYSQANSILQDNMILSFEIWSKLRSVDFEVIVVAVHANLK